MTPDLSDQERLTNYETLTHILRVQHFLHQAVAELLRRAEGHDASKLTPPELPVFVEYTPKLKQCKYGSETYQRYLQEMRSALAHHYAVNRHHPEHFPHGVADMTLIDLLEMCCDWMAAAERHSDKGHPDSAHSASDRDANLRRSQERFGLSDQLTRILRNTMEVLRDENA